MYIALPLYVAWSGHYTLHYCILVSHQEVSLSSSSEQAATTIIYHPSKAQLLDLKG